MATPVKRRLVVRAEHLVHTLPHDPVDHVRYSKAPLPTSSCLRNPDPPDLSRLVGPFQQAMRQRRQDRPQMLSHLVDRLPVRSRCSVVRRHFLERFLQVLFPCDFLDRHRGQAPSLRALRLRRPGWSSPESAPVPPPVGPFRVVGCLGDQFELPAFFAGRGRLPSPSAFTLSYGRLSSAFWSYAAIRLLSSLRHQSFRPF